MPSKRTLLATLLIPIALVTWGCGSARPTNVLLVTLEGVRGADKGGARQDKGAIPSLDRLGSRGWRCDLAVTPSPGAAPAAASILSGLTPASHGMTDDILGRVKPDVPLVAEQLRRAGYRTAAFIGSRAIGWRSGLARGFERFDESPDGTIISFDAAQVAPRGWDKAGRRREPVEISQEALRWIRAEDDAPSFVWLHLAAAAEQSPASREGPWGTAETAASLAGIEDALGVLLQGLEDLDRMDSTVVYIVGTSGYGRGEHGEWTNGLGLYDTTIRVPFVIAGRGYEPREIEGPISTALVADLIRRDAGLETGEDHGIPPSSGEAVSVTWTPLADFGWPAIAAIRTRTLSYVEGSGTELYDVEADPEQTENLAGSRPDVTADLSARLSAAAPFGESGPPSSQPISTSERDRAMNFFLESGSALSAEEPKHAEALLRQAIDASPSNPTLLVRLARIVQARAGVASALESLGPLKVAAATSPWAAMKLATILSDLGQLDESQSILERLAGEPGSAARARIALSTMLTRAQSYERAADALAPLAAVEPGDPRLAETLGDMYLAVGYGYRAAASYQKALDAGYRTADLLLKLGDCRLLLKDTTGALDLYRELLEEDPSSGIAHMKSGDALIAMGNPEEALAEYRASFPMTPDGFDRGMQVADRVMTRGADTVAFGLYSDLAAIRPDRFEPHFRIGELLLRGGKLDEAEAAMRHAASLEPANPSPHYQLARLAIARKDEAEAGRQMQAVIDSGVVSLLEQAQSDPVFASLPADSDLRQVLTRAGHPPAMSAPAPSGPGAGDSGEGTNPGTRSGTN